MSTFSTDNQLFAYLIQRSKAYALEEIFFRICLSEYTEKRRYYTNTTLSAVYVMNKS